MDFRVFDPSETNETRVKLSEEDIRFLTNLVEMMGIERATRRLTLRLDAEDRDRIRLDRA